MSVLDSIDNFASARVARLRGVTPPRPPMGSEAVNAAASDNPQTAVTWAANAAAADPRVTEAAAAALRSQKRIPSYFVAPGWTVSGDAQQIHCTPGEFDTLLTVADATWAPDPVGSIPTAAWQTDATPTVPTPGVGYIADFGPNGKGVKQCMIGFAWGFTRTQTAQNTLELQIDFSIYESDTAPRQTIKLNVSPDPRAWSSQDQYTGWIWIPSSVNIGSARAPRFMPIDSPNPGTNAVIRVLNGPGGGASANYAYGYVSQEALQKGRSAVRQAMRDADQGNFTALGEFESRIIMPAA